MICDPLRGRVYVYCFCCRIVSRRYCWLAFNHNSTSPLVTLECGVLQDLLRPFLLACNHADASPHLMNMAMGSIQYLINRDAILPSDAPNILRCEPTDTAVKR